MGAHPSRIITLLADLPLRPTIGAALIIGLLLPAGLVAWQEVSERRATLFEHLANDHVRIVETLAIGMQTPIWDVRPDTGQPLIDAIMKDKRVVAVNVAAPVLPRFLEAAKPGSEAQVTVTLERPVVREDSQIGTVRVEMTTDPLAAEVARQGWQAFLAVLLQMGFGLLLIFPLIRFKVLAPLRQVVAQSQGLASGKLDEPFDWRRRDELGALGRSFEDTRRSLQRLFRDLERRNAELEARETALHRQTRILRATLDNMTDGISLIDSELRLLAWNDRFINLFEFPAGVVHEGVSMPDLHRFDVERGQYAPVAPEAFFERMRQGFEPGRSFTDQLERADGTVILLRRQPLPDGGFVSTYTDLTERKRMQQALSDSEELYRLLVDQSPYGILLHDVEAIVFVNPAGCRILGTREAEQITGRHYREFVAPSDREEGLTRLKRILELGESVEQTERCLVTLDGREIIAATSGVPFTRGEKCLALVIFVDITTMKQAEAEITRQREALHQAEKISALGSLLAGVAHELNNPLSVVVGRSIMLGDSDLTQPVADNIAKIRTAAERCARIVKTFLAMARQQAPSRVPVRIAALVDSSLDLLAYGLESAGVRVRKHLPADLPETMADPDQLSQVFNNLITNARQAMVGWNGPRELQLSAAVDRSLNQLQITVADTGPGIVASVRSRVFDPFFTTKPMGAGTGIGLAVCRGIVEAHGGMIAVENPPAGGAVFVVTLPIISTRSRVEDDEIEWVNEAAAPSRILIVDDEEEIRDMLGEILTAAGHRVEEAANGEQALARLAERRFDLVISDLIMPVMDGPGLYEELQRSKPELTERVIFITGDTLSYPAQQFLKRSRRPVIEKPFVPEEVRRAVRERLG